jgi:peptidoglycan hydrolase-like protein with peptidoglycan-binding domain
MLQMSMSKLSLKVLLGVFALMCSASVGLSTECKDDPNECTPKNLCEVATQVINDNKVWSKDASAAKHIAFVKEIGMECGVVEITDPCDLDPNDCKVKQLCERATTGDDGSKSWSADAEAYVELAKEYGLSCDVKTGSTSSGLTKIGKGVDVRKAQLLLVDLCFNPGPITGVWNSQTDEAFKSFYSRIGKFDGNFDHFMMRILLGVRNGTLDTKVEACNRSAKTNNANLTKIGNSSSEEQKTDIDLKKVQNFLTELCYNPGPIDGIWGKKTESAFRKFYSDLGKKYNGNFTADEMRVLSDEVLEVDESDKCKINVSKRGSKNKQNKTYTQSPNEKLISTPLGDYIKGVNAQQWAVIRTLGDPQNCERRIKALQKKRKGILVSQEEYESNPDILEEALETSNTVFLSNGVFKLKQLIELNNKILIGSSNTVIEADGQNYAIYMSGSSIQNLHIRNAGKVGVTIFKNSNVHRVIVENTGVNNSNNTRGHGFSILEKTSSNNCLVSVEAFNGYNDDGSSTGTKNGGNADGFQIKYGANSVTLIDAHGHNNSDDGFDFWKAGDGTNYENDDTIIRVYYSSANLNGKNPFTPNGDGNGFKMGSADKYQTPKKDRGARFVYGSVACRNLNDGFTRNATNVRLNFSKLQALGNGRKNYRNVRENFRTAKDQYVLKCKMFPKE